MLRTLASRWNKEKFRCYGAKIEESEKGASRRESNPGHLACAEDWLHKPGVLGSIPGDCRPFHFPLAAQARCPGFNFWQLPALSLSSIFAS